jgi:hypothetical protein
VVEQVCTSAAEPVPKNSKHIQNFLEASLAWAIDLILLSFVFQSKNNTTTRVNIIPWNW